MHFLSSFSEFNQKLACNIGLVTVKVPFGDLPALCNQCFRIDILLACLTSASAAAKQSIWDNL